MNLIGIDLEGVLIPEIWEELARQTGEKDLTLTTRDIKDYKELMDHRINVLNAKGIKAKKLFDIAKNIIPYEGAIDFLNKLRKDFQVIILSDTFYNLSKNIFEKLNFPTVFCHTLLVSEDGMVIGMNRCINDHKRITIEYMNKMNFNTIAVGDSYNDMGMLAEANEGILFRTTDKIKKDYPDYFNCDSYDQLITKIYDIFKKGEIK